jgi:phospholipase D1/2
LTPWPDCDTEADTEAMDFHGLLRKAKQGLEDLIPGDEKHSHTHDGHECHEDDAHAEYSTNRYCSFAPQSSGHPKWYVDGASYFWAVSMALEGNMPPPLGDPHASR